MKYTIIAVIVGFLLLINAQGVFAQGFEVEPTEDLGPSIVASESAMATASADEEKKLEQIKKEDITNPEEIDAKKEFVALFSKRPLDSPTPLNFMGYSVQYAVKAGVPANTVILIFLLPFLATLIVFFRQIIGFASLEMWVPIALSITLIATGIAAGSILLLTIIFASVIARIILKKIRVMQLSKMALSVLVVSVFVFISLTISASAGILTVKQLSIFPILLLILLSEKIVSLQLTRSLREAMSITTVTLFLGMLGVIVLTADIVREYILLYPELLLVLVPLNIIMGRYFGLRFTEMYRFSHLRKYANK